MWSFYSSCWWILMFFFVLCFFFLKSSCEAKEGLHGNAMMFVRVVILTRGVCFASLFFEGGISGLKFRLEFVLSIISFFKYFEFSLMAWQSSLVLSERLVGDVYSHYRCRQGVKMSIRFYTTATLYRYHGLVVISCQFSQKTMLRNGLTQKWTAG